MSQSRTPGTERRTGPNEGQKTHDKVDEARRDVGDTVSHARSAAEKAGSDLNAAARADAEGRKREAEHQADAKSNDMARSIDRAASELDRASEDCQDQDRWAGDLFAAGAKSLHAASGYLSGNDPKQMMGDAERFARDNPAAFLGASVAAGFLLSRFGKVATARAEAQSASDFTSGLSENPNHS